MQIIVCLILIYTVNHIINKLDFKMEYLQLGIIYFLDFCIVLAFSYAFHWFGFRLKNILMCVIIYGIISAWITVHNNKINKQDEIWINRKLEQRNKIIQEIEDTRGEKEINESI